MLDYCHYFYRIHTKYRKLNIPFRFTDHLILYPLKLDSVPLSHPISEKSVSLEVDTNILNLSLGYRVPSFPKVSLSVGFINLVLYHSASSLSGDWNSFLGYQNEAPANSALTSSVLL